VNAIVPISRVELSFRTGTIDDIAFMDALQKKHGKALGHFTTGQYEGYVKLGAVLIAEAGGAPVGYIISRDRYLKRDELGVIFQLCVADGQQRKLVGASLVREAFERSAYGCRLYCLWCAQDLDANYFWESLGFVPIAFRAGSERKKKGGRVHIFWQKRIVEGDTETKWWYPFQTAGGALRADRIVFPIPEGVHWRDVQAVAVPTETKLALPDQTRAVKPREPKKAAKPAPRPMGGFRFQSEVDAEKPVKTPKEKKPKAQGGAAKIDPKYLKAARELRDRWMEHVNAKGVLLESSAKYDVARAIEAAPVVKQLSLAA
jgi:hypothetical protein